MKKDASDLEMLNAWVHWVKLNPASEDQLEMAKAIANICSQVGTWKAKYEQVNGERFKENCAHMATQEQLTERNAEITRLQLECSGMGQLLQSGVVIKTAEYEKFIRLKEDVARLRSALNEIAREECSGDCDAGDCGACLTCYARFALIGEGKK